jgi:hypothetical protein
MISVRWIFHGSAIAALDRRKREKVEVMLEAAVAELRAYPPYRGRGPALHVRTGNLASSTRYRIRGDSAEILAPSYARYLIHGTGVYGDRGAPITGDFWIPVRNPEHPNYPRVLRVKSVRGTIWRGKKEAIIRAVQRAVRRR